MKARLWKHMSFSKYRLEHKHVVEFIGILVEKVSCDVFDGAHVPMGGCIAAL